MLRNTPKKLYHRRSIDRWRILERIRDVEVAKEVLAIRVFMCLCPCDHVNAYTHSKSLFIFVTKCDSGICGPAREGDLCVHGRIIENQSHDSGTLIAYAHGQSDPQSRSGNRYNGSKPKHPSAHCHPSADDVHCTSAYA